jgi:hypothetical protein
MCKATVVATLGRSDGAGLSAVCSLRIFVFVRRTSATLFFLLHYKSKIILSDFGY